jgi:hypothetical protein
MFKLLAALLAAGKLGKVLVTAGSMLLSVIASAFVFGWWYAVGFVGLIFVHEMGLSLAGFLAVMAHDVHDKLSAARGAGA